MNEELIKQLHEAANNVSYYNAAEGNWGQEREARGLANAEFNKIYKECVEAGIDVKPLLKGYLL